MSLSRVEAAKRLAAISAVDDNITPAHSIIGVGSGSTVVHVVDRLAQLGDANKNRRFVPSGFQSRELIVNAGLNLAEVDQCTAIDVTIDGADEVDDNLHSIKGGGACQYREMILARMSKEWVIVADYRKNSKTLGTQWTQGVPIEIAEFGYTTTKNAIISLGATSAELRMGKAKAGPVVTDNGNLVVDAVFPQEMMKDPVSLRSKIKALTGVLEVGLFVSMAKAAYFGMEDGSVQVRSPHGTRTVAAPEQ